jgi:nitroreductase
MEASMDAVECITSRRSIRAFQSEPVERSILTEVLDAARWSPSYKNTQPWELLVLSGEKKKELSQLLVELFEAGEKPTPDLETPLGWPEPEQARIDHLFRMRKEATGLDLGDPEVIRRAKKANFNFYQAPHAIYLYQEDSLTRWSLFDLGIFAQSLMLAAHARGLGTVAQAFATDYAAQTKEFLGLPASKRLVLGLAIGYPDRNAPANQLRTERSPLKESCRWLE